MKYVAHKSTFFTVPLKIRCHIRSSKDCSELSKIRPTCVLADVVLDHYRIAEGDSSKEEMEKIAIMRTSVTHAT